MTTFYLVRHGQIDRTVDGADPPLSAPGRAEAKQVAAYLHPCPIKRVYASPLRRAQETAAAIASVFGLPIITEPRLRERINYGDLPGQSFEQFVAVWEQASRERDFVPPSGDSSRRAGQRVEAFMAQVYTELPAAEVVAVAHGGIIADFLFNVCTLETLRRISPAFATQPYAGEIMRHGAVTTVEYRGADDISVKAIAVTSHLPSIA